MTLHDLIFIPAAGIGGAFFPAADCTNEWILRSWHDGHYRSARESLVCKDEPYQAGKAPSYVVDVAKQVTTGTAPTLAGIPTPTGTTIVPATQRGLEARGSGHDLGVTWNRHVVMSGIPGPRGPHTPPGTVAPVPLPVAGWLLLAALVALIFVRRKK